MTVKNNKLMNSLKLSNKLSHCLNICSSKAILLLWFLMFCVLESIFVLFERFVRFHILVQLR